MLDGYVTEKRSPPGLHAKSRSSKVFDPQALATTLARSWGSRHLLAGHPRRALQGRVLDDARDGVGSGKVTLPVSLASSRGTMVVFKPAIFLTALASLLCDQPQRTIIGGL